MKVSPNIIKTEITEPFYKEAQKHLVFIIILLLLLLLCLLLDYSLIFSKVNNVRQHVDFFLQDLILT